MMSALIRWCAGRAAERRCSYFCSPEELELVRADRDGRQELNACCIRPIAIRHLPPDTAGRMPERTGRARGIERSGCRWPATRSTTCRCSPPAPGVGGQSEPAWYGTQQLAHVLHADAPGCGGILQAIDHFNLLAANDPHRKVTRDTDTGDAELVMVYHRLPYEEVIEDGKRVRRQPQSPNGIIPSLLGFFGSGRKGSWVAWSIDDAARVTSIPRSIRSNSRI